MTHGPVYLLIFFLKKMDQNFFQENFFLFFSRNCVGGAYAVKVANDIVIHPCKVCCDGRKSGLLAEKAAAYKVAWYPRSGPHWILLTPSVGKLM